MPAPPTARGFASTSMPASPPPTNVLRGRVPPGAGGPRGGGPQARHLGGLDVAPERHTFFGATLGLACIGAPRLGVVLPPPFGHLGPDEPGTPRVDSKARAV